ncbi:MAG: hemerythrin domain-containing protein [Patescibacteria group bacterium]
MAENSILNLMISHHALIDALFSLFRDEVREKSPRARASLSELDWELKKHWFAEENAIFNFLPLKNIEIWKTINHLKDEHLTMLNDLKKFSESLLEIKGNEIENFYKLLEDHRATEEKDLYPKLDKELREEQKAQIISRINEIPINT